MLHVYNDGHTVAFHTWQEITPHSDLGALFI